MMGGLICVKCGETALSKCPHTRSIFLEHQLDAFLGGLTRVVSTPPPAEVKVANPDVLPKLTLSFDLTYYQIPGVEGQEEKVAIDFLKNLVKSINSQQVSIQKVICNHKWLLLPGFRSGSADCGCSYEKQSAEDKIRVESLIHKYGMEVEGVSKV
jgi:hypothetical protein